MIAIAVQTMLSLLLCFAIGFATAWAIRGGREERKFQAFFDKWRSRYDQLERDCDVHLEKISALQNELNVARGPLGKSSRPDSRRAAPTAAIESAHSEKTI